MTVPVSTTNRVSFTANGVLVLFSSTFTIFDVDDLEVRVDGAVVTTGFTAAILTNATYDSIIAVTFAVAPANLAIVELIRKITFKQELNFTNNSIFDIENLERGLDNLTLQTQELNTVDNRSIKFVDSLSGDTAFNTTAETAGTITANKAARLGKAMIFHSVTGDLTLSDTSFTGLESDISALADVTDEIEILAPIAANITAVAGDATDIGVVAGKATEIGRLGTADAVADMVILGTADVVTDMNVLATADVVTDMNVLGTADVVTDMNTLGTADVVSYMNTLGTADVVNDMNVLGTGANVTNMNTLSGISGNITTVAGISSNITTVAGKSTEIGLLGVAGVITDMGILGTADVVSDMNILGTADVVSDMNVLATADVVTDMNVLATADVVTDMNTLGTADNVTNMDTVADNLAGVNSFAEKYKIAATAPTGPSEGDLWYDTTSDVMKVYDSDAAAWAALGGLPQGLATTDNVEFATIKLTGGSPGAAKVLTSDADGDATWEIPASTPTITNFQYSDGATATAEDVLGGVITITGTGFDSILAGMSVNVGVTFGGTTATSISVNAGKTIITATAPAKPAGTVTMLVTNASGLSAERDFIYDPLPTLTTGTGTLGTFIDGIYTTSSTGTLTAPVFAGPTEGGVAVTYAQATSASDDTIITTGVQGLYVDSVSGKLIGTLGAGAVATTYPFYGISVDDENQRSIPRLFNIISAINSSATDPSSGVIGHDTYDIGSDTYIVYTFLTVGTSVITFSASTSNVEVLVVAGGGGGGGQIGGGGGAGGLLTFTSLTLSGAYNVIVGNKGVAQGNTDEGTVGGDSQFEGSTLVKGGGYGGVNDIQVDGGPGGSGGGAGENSAGPHDGGAATSGQGTDGGASNSTDPYSAGGGGGSSTGGAVSNAPDNDGAGGIGGVGGAGTANSYRTGSPVTYAGGGGGGSWGTGGNGGAGGGGTGCSSTSNDATVGIVNTGSGGGGGGNGASTSGKDGGTGIVVVRYVV